MKNLKVIQGNKTEKCQIDYVNIYLRSALRATEGIKDITADRDALKNMFGIL